MTPLRLGLATALLSISLQAYAEANADCPVSAEAAARRFIEVGVSDPGKSVTLIRASRLAPLRARLAQLFSDRYSPASPSLRETLLGAEWTEARIRDASDAELVGAYLAGGRRGRVAPRLSGTQVLSARKTAFMGDEITLSYRLSAGVRTNTQQRTLNAHPEGRCWKLDPPIETWERLDQMAQALKASRPSSLLPREAAPRVTLKVAPASRSPSPGATETPLRSGNGAVSSIWVDNDPLVTELDVVEAAASWDCEGPGLGPESPAIRFVLDQAGARRLNAWSGQHLGASITIMMDGEAKMFATVRDALHDRLTICLPSATLDEAESFTAALLGRK